MKHTPGPWRQVGHAVLYSINPGTRDVTEGQVASAHTPADACLISAAPEILECLKDALEFVAPQYGYDSRLADLLTRSRAAIAKATGERK